MHSYTLISNHPAFSFCANNNCLAYLDGVEFVKEE